jgi:hypothetical protein
MEVVCEGLCHRSFGVGIYPRWPLVAEGVPQFGCGINNPRPE